MISSYVPHAEIKADGILFSVQVPEGEKASLLLYEKGSSEVRYELPFPDEALSGRVFAMKVTGVPAREMEYNYRVGGRVVTDPQAMAVTGLERFGDPHPRQPHQLRASFPDPSFDWQDDAPLRIPYSDSFFYELHVRGFTKSASSGVKHRGTFLGLTEKIPHLKALGVTAVMLMPCYEYDEVLPERPRAGWRPKGLMEMTEGSALPASAIMQSRSGQDSGAGQTDAARASLQEAGAAPVREQEAERRVNYWGFGPGWYFAPKRSFSSGADPADEFRLMVRTLHSAGIEVIMEFNWAEGTDPACMRSCLLWWRRFYHVDGFWMTGPQEDIHAAAKSPALSDVKLISDYFDTSRVYPKGRPYRLRNLAECNAGFRNDARRFLKGDPDSLQPFVERCRRNPKDAGVINSITGHDGFTLHDLVSYNDKHNEANGENNRDGAPNEYSWNCGTEGPSRKRDISRLRLKQMKNALALAMLAQGTPMITAGDEMLNSQSGNSNPYCFDSELTWVRWSASKDAQELTEYLKKLSAFRMEHPLLHQTQELTGSAAGGVFPDFSCHGANAWFASFDQQDRSVGMMYCSQEPDRDAVSPAQDSAVQHLYAAYNFHWEARELALPYLPAGREWHTVIDTSGDRFSAGKEDAGKDGAQDSSLKEKSILVPGRTIIVLVG